MQGPKIPKRDGSKGSGKAAIIELVDERIAKTAVVREDFTELKAAMVRLADSQATTDARLLELAQAHAASEARLDQKLDQLTDRMDQFTGRMDQLTERMDQLAVRMDQLAENIAKLTDRMNQLVESQEHTEAVLCTLSKEHEKTRGQVGGLAITVGYMIENVAYTSLPKLLERDHGITELESLHRRYVPDYAGRPMEVNIYGKGVRDGREILVIGESKSQLSKNKIDDFLRRKLENLPKTDAAVFPVMVTHMIAQPDAEEYARAKGIAIYYTYQFPWSIPLN